jgi:hypothetical protein
MPMRILNGDHAEFEREHANTKPEDRPDWPLPSFDARDWAKAFCKRFPTVPEDDAIAWFANALMRGFDERPSPNVDAAYEVICNRLAPLKSKDKVRAAVIEALRAA